METRGTEAANEDASNAPSKPATYHVLLVGIDNYPVGALAGCVNDIDAVQRVLLDGLKLPAGCITRLAAPRPGITHDTRVPEQLPTLANLRAALTELGTDKVGPDDRVFIYYSGHGLRRQFHSADGSPIYRESLVPMDLLGGDSLRLLFDYQLNPLLQAIAQRTRQVALVLDSCFAAGATRDDPDPDVATRHLDETDVPALRMPAPDPAGATRGDPLAGRALTRGLDDIHVVTACLDHERSVERPNADGVRHGVMTQALITVLAPFQATGQATGQAAGLDQVTWAMIWQALRAEVEQRNSMQHVWMSGNAARRVFAGPPVQGDPGIPVVRADAGYRVLAGTLAGVTPGAELAIYDDVPDDFPALGSEADLDARHGVIVVTTADKASATAVPAPPGGPTFDLPRGARARVIRPGELARLSYAIDPANPSLDPSLGAALDAALGASPLLVRAATAAAADVRLTQHAGRWYVTDDLHGTGGADGPVLYAVPGGDLDGARAVLEHYHAYSRPLHMANAARDLPGALTLRALLVNQDLGPASAQEASLPQAPAIDPARLRDAPSRGAATYAVTSNDKLCFFVANTWSQPLQVTLVSAGASGKVALLGEAVIEPGAHVLFWSRNVLANPFRMVPPAGMTECADRMFAIGRSVVGHELAHLAVGRSFDTAFQRSHTKDPTDAADQAATETADAVARAAALDRWTATQIVIFSTRAS
ncbi:MAG TPA: caspase family protein [Kofleriaceae bacterium]|nr:caspase family protein [Kofleriaceae bacterium]